MQRALTIPRAAIDQQRCQLWQHIPIDVTSLCPVTGNFQPGTVAVLSYRAARSVLRYEVLHAEVRSYAGGRRAASSAEDVLSQLARWVAELVAAPVKLRVHALLHDGSTVLLTVRARPTPDVCIIGSDAAHGE